MSIAAVATARTRGLSRRVGERWSNLLARGIQRAMTHEMAKLGEPSSARRLGSKDAYCRLAQWLPQPAEKQHVLEVGCGPGKYVALLSALGFTVTGVDPHEFPQWERLRDAHGCRLMNRVHAEKLPFPDRSFDHVTCLGTLLYLKDPDQGFREIRRVLRPGGQLIVRNVNRGNHYTRRTGMPLDPASQNLYTMNELRSFLESHGFAIEDSYAWGYFPARWIGFHWYLMNVWYPYILNDAMSHWCAPRDRVNNVVRARLA